jgi:hypothetical protein
MGLTYLRSGRGANHPRPPRETHDSLSDDLGCSAWIVYSAVHARKRHARVRNGLGTGTGIKEERTPITAAVADLVNKAHVQMRVLAKS